MAEIIGVRFKSGGKQYYFDPQGAAFQEGQGVIVDTSRGVEYGWCAQANTQVAEEEVVQPLRPVLRAATPEDDRIMEKNKEKEKKAFQICQEKIVQHGLDMKLVEAEYSFEGNKVLFFFTSDGRVDFRALVKDLAGTIHARIELRQIGVRDEAKMLGGLGICGRPFCCSQFLDDFQPVSIKMAKTQNLSLNPTKISGTCGRLMCCLKYEQDAYEDAIKRMPKNDSFVVTPDGPGNVSDINVLKETVNVRLDERPDTPRCYHNCEVCVLRNGKGSRDGIVVPKERPERYVEPVAAEEMLIPDLFADYGEPTAPQPEEERPSRRRRRGGRRRRKEGAAPEAENAQTAQKKEKSERPDRPARVEKADKPSRPSPAKAEGERREEEQPSRRRRSRGGRGGENRPNTSAPQAAAQQGVPGTQPRKSAAPQAPSSPRPDGAPCRPRHRGGRRRSGGSGGGTPTTEA